MDELLKAIRAATAGGASDEVRAVGAAACRTILTALEAKAGEPLVPSASSAPAGQASSVAALVSALRNVPPDQLLDMAIARLRAALPEGVTVPTVDPVKFQVIQLPASLGKRSQ